jgi:NADPH2:quinone reductase
MPIAIEMQSYGPPDVLRAVPRPMPAPGEHEVVVRMIAAGVNRADLFIRSGEWPIGGPFPYVPGLEVCGVVERAGAAVRDVAEGDQVITMMQRLGGVHGTRAGGYQTHVLVPADTLVRLPPGLDPIEAAGFGLAAVTAYLAIEVLGARGEGRVLVHGGSSGVGSMAIQILAAGWNEVVATGTRPEKFGFMRECGAREVVDTRRPGWSKDLGPIGGVLDLVGRAVFAESVDALSPGGRLVFAGGTSGGELSFSGWDLMKPVTLTGYSSETLTRGELARAMNAIAALRALGALRVVRAHEFALEDAAEAHRALESGRVEGRVLLRCRAPWDSFF